MDLRKRKKNDPTIFCVEYINVNIFYVEYFIPKDTNRFKVKGWENICHTNINQKRARVAILKWDKIDFKTKVATRVTEGHLIIMKESIHQEDKTIRNMCT